MPPTPKIKFCGFYSRCAFAHGQAEIRFHPLEFTQDPDARPVWSLVFEDVDFDASALEGFSDSEEGIEVEIYDRHAIFHDAWSDTRQTLSAKRLAAIEVAYDAAELHERMRQLKDEIAHLHDDLRNALTKDIQGRALLRELLRRAEIKAAASDHLRERQSAAIEVLKRLTTHFGD
ncbi:hypothetical protein [Caulobacter hibisci]|uniref:Uncharacterized protein n=1 Tax=Caulobacter hibisci TaxID=2035993 RepID=A0ABS0T0U4_9CAUL|nr:hypothetical protein [Caulobacter hibisci]MBI1685490.1 hypothetical protein [Caulobacter hibisci]